MNALASAEPAVAAGETQPLSAVFEGLDAARVRWCLLRDDPRRLASAADVDLLVDPHDLEAAAGAFGILGYARVPALGRGSHRFFVGYDSGSGSWHELDVVTELAYGPNGVLRTEVAEACLERRRRAGAAHVLGPNDEFWTLLLHCLLDKGKFRPDHAARLHDLESFGNEASDLPGVIDEIGGLGTAGALRAGVRSADWIGLARDGRTLRRTWLMRHAGRVARSVATAGLLRLVEKQAVVRHRRGVSVALLGIDGAGKSTLVTGLVEAFPFPVRTVYMGLWSDRGLLARNGATRALRAAVRPVLAGLRYLHGRLHQVLGRLVVFDRYTYDALIPPRPPLVRLKRLYFALLAKTCPAPDLVLLLDLPPDVAAARKPDHDLRELQRQRQAFLALVASLQRFEVIDADRDAEAVRADVVERVWRLYLERWSRP